MRICQKQRIRYIKTYQLIKMVIGFLQMVGAQIMCQKINNIIQIEI